MQVYEQVGAHYSVLSNHIVSISSISGSVPSMNKLGWIEYFITSLDFDLVYLIYYVTAYKLKYEQVIVFTYIVPNEFTEPNRPACDFLSQYMILQRTISTCKSLTFTILKYFFFFLKGTCSVSVNENESFLLKVNSCPRCREKINKHSSRVITCKCGNYFCWDCLRPVADHKVGDICGKLSEEVYKNM